MVTSASCIIVVLRVASSPPPRTPRMWRWHVSWLLTPGGLGGCPGGGGGVGGAAGCGSTPNVTIFSAPSAKAKVVCGRTESPPG
eukprot:scaffold60327_cov60-Phaeocystis_antarctica.AAC.8